MQVLPNTRRHFRKSKWWGNGNRWCWSQLLQGLVWWAQKLLPKWRGLICAFKVQFLVWPLAAFWGRIDFGSNKLSSVAQSSDSLWPHEPQHARLPCLSPTPGVHPNPCPSSRWCHPTISSSVVPFSCPQSFPASGSFQMSQLFTSGGQSIGISASTSVLPMNTQDWSPLGSNKRQIIYVFLGNLGK